MSDKFNSYSKIFSIILLLLILSSLLLNYYLYNLKEIFWICDISGIVTAFALYFKNKRLLSMLIFLVLPSLSLWTIDTLFQIYDMYLGTYVLLGPLGTLTYIISIFFHLATYTILFYGVSNLGFIKKDLFLALIIIFFILLIGHFFTTPQENYNCSLYPCNLDYNADFNQISNSHFYFTWNYFYFVYFVWASMIILSYYFHIYLFKKLKIKIEKT